MKIISLNCWRGKLYEPLIEFIKSNREKVDIFCFQEMVFGGPDEFFNDKSTRGQLFEKIKDILGDFNAYSTAADNAYYSDRGKNYLITGGVKIGQAIFSKKNILVSVSGSFLAYAEENNPFRENLRGNITGKCQYINIKVDGREVSLINIHGLWQGGKDDTPERLEQSRRILRFIEDQNKPAIVIGDFNFFPNTQSVAILSEKLRNLISEYKITLTRSKFYYDMEKYKDYIADYAFVSPEIILNDFCILEDEVSDHLPLFLDF